jgi:hypothetical protein
MTVVGRVRLRRTIPSIVALLALGLVSSPSLARKSKRPSNGEVIGACITNYKSGLEQERTGKLLEARELFIRCAKSACGSPLREECTMRFTQLGTDIPSIVPVVTNAAGKPETNIEVAVDGARLTSTLDGHSFVLDPGPHDFSFSKDGHIFASTSLMIVQGQRNRLIAASLQPGPSDEAPRPAKVSRPEARAVAAAVTSEPETAPLEKAPSARGVDLAPVSTSKTAAAPPQGADLTARAEPTPRRHIPVLSLVTAGVGVAALGAGALLTYWGRKDTDLLGPCSPSCSPASADHIHNLYLAADISIGVGIAALAGSYWAYARSRSTQEAGEEEVAVRSTPTLVVAPTPSGAVGALAGHF